MAVEFEDPAAATRVFSPVAGYPVEEAEWIPASYFSDQDALQEDVCTGRIPEEQ